MKLGKIQLLLICIRYAELLYGDIESSGSISTLLRKYSQQVGAWLQLLSYYTLSAASGPSGRLSWNLEGKLTKLVLVLSGRTAFSSDALTAEA